jgi:hypothetical protein
MKRKIAYFTSVLAGVFIFYGSSTVANAASRTSGVYLTAADYQSERISFPGECKSKEHRLELHDILNKPYIDVTHDAEKKRYSKDELFGFRACDGRDYRFSAKLEYKIVEAKALYVYSRDEQETYGKGSRTIVRYYFSAGSNGPILPFSLENLKKAVPDNHKFHDLLDSNFSAGQNLEEYDSFHKMFKVNRLLVASQER